MQAGLNVKLVSEKSFQTFWGVYFPVYFSIFYEIYAKVFEFFDLFQLSIVEANAEFSCCSTDLHSFCLAEAYFPTITLTSIF